MLGKLNLDNFHFEDNTVSLKSVKDFNCTTIELYYIDKILKIKFVSMVKPIQNSILVFLSCVAEESSILNACAICWAL